MIGQAVNNGASQKTKQTGDNVIQFSFAGPGDASTRSVTCERHAHAKYQSTHEIPDNIGCGHIREFD